MQIACAGNDIPHIIAAVSGKIRLFKYFFTKRPQNSFLGKKMLANDKTLLYNRQCFFKKHGPLAQLVEHLTLNQGV